MPKKSAANTATKKSAAQTKEAKRAAAKKNPLFEKRTRNFGIGGNIQPKRDVTRFVRWPHYVKLQRQKRVLLHRLKVPPTINQFTRTLDKSNATALFKLLNKYRPETKAAKKQRLLKVAEAKTKGETTSSSKPNFVKYGINHITGLIEQKKAKLVVIAHDVDPVELVVWLPTLCRKQNVPYVIVKGKARLGTVVHHKTATALAITSVDKEDVKDLTTLVDLGRESYNNNVDSRRTWGGGKLGNKSVAAQRKKEKAVAKEEAARQQ
jgi:large subunit ribosomal protein L7Ae